MKIALLAVAIFMFAGANAQITTINHTGQPETGTNYVIAGATETYQTVNVGFRLYVRPDVVYSPSYTGGGAINSGLNANSLWQWKFGTDATFAGGTSVKGPANENWVLLTPSDLPAAEAARTFWVLETNALFTCTGTATSHTVNVVPAPNATIAGVGGAGWTTVAANNFRRCASGADIGDVLNITLTENTAPLAAQNYTFGITVTQIALDGNLVEGATTDVTATYGKTANTAALAAGLSQTHTISPLPLIAPNVPTRYRFTLTANSITSMISLRSYLRAGIPNVGYSGAVTNIDYTILPVPTTGPIFHIPNAW